MKWRRALNRPTILFVVFVHLIISIILVNNVAVGYSPSYVNNVLIYVVLLIYLQAKVYRIQYNFPKLWLRLDITFMCMYSLVHFWFWLSIRYFSDNNVWNIVTSYDGADRSITVSLIGLVSFIFGFNVYFQRAKNYKRQIKLDRNLLVIGKRMLKIGLILFIVYAARIGPQLFQGRYEGSEIGDFLTKLIYMLHQSVFSLGAIIYLVSVYRQKNLKISIDRYITGIGFVLLMYLVLGDRSAFMVVCGSLVAVYAFYGRMISRLYIVIGILCSSVLLNAVGISRKAEVRGLVGIFDEIMNLNSFQSIFHGFDVIGSSAQVLLVAVQNVPSRYGYFLGELKIVEFFGLIPFGSRLLEIGEWGTSSDFLTSMVFNYWTKTGVGTTIVADIYVDFGVVGVGVVLFVTGLLIGKCQEILVYGGSSVSVILVCVSIGLIFVWPRYSFLFLFNNMFIPVAMLALLRAYSDYPIFHTSAKL